ncbi:MAG: Crp/Fnr family transcriptional regulator [Pseudomonadota bacterium]
MNLEKGAPGAAVPPAGGDAGVAQHFFRKLSVFHDLPAELIASVQSMQHRQGGLPQGVDVVHAGEPYDGVYILNQGWAVRYRILSDGNRQIANFILPGDFMCLNACIFPRADFTITTLTPIRYSQFRTEEIVRLTEMHPLMCAAIFWCNAREESILVEHLASIGRRSAYSRVAHLVLELWRRLKLIGLVEDGNGRLESTFELPLTQQLIADALGLSSIHVNRTLRALENDGFIVCERREGVRRLWIKNIEGLGDAAGFDDEFLHFTELPRRVGLLLEEAERRRRSK